MNRTIILKNDRVGDLFTSIQTINLIFNKHKNDEIEIFLSEANHKFSFLFKSKKVKIINLKLKFLDKLNIFFYFLINKIDHVYILSPKNFYFYIPLIFFFKKIKFYGLCIDSKKKRPPNILRKFLFKTAIIDRQKIKSRKSTYITQQELVDYDGNLRNLINSDLVSNLKVEIPENSVFFHYKHKIFNDLLNWDLDKVKTLIKFLSNKKGSLIFSSELNNKFCDDYFYAHFNSYDFKLKKLNKINSEKILFLKNIDGLDLFTAIKNSKQIIAPEGIITHIGYYLNKKILSLMHFKLKNRKDFINQIISCKEWFPPNNFEYSVLKKDFQLSLNKLTKRI